MSTPRLLIAALGSLGSFTLVGVAPAQGSPPLDPDARIAAVSSFLTVFEGFVLEPDGAPAEGAVVVSSAGGRAVTDWNGHYLLEVEVPLEAECVQITAVDRASANLASTSVPLPASRGREVDPLQLTQGSTCQPGWLPTFGGRPGVSGRVWALAVYDDGRGPALYAGGLLDAAGAVSASRIVRWDGHRWEGLGGGVGGGFAYVWALAVYDDGRGPALFVGGQFTRAGPRSANHIARWDGSRWEAVGGGVSGPNSALGVYSLTVHDDGTGPALYVGGNFTTAGGVAASCIAKWDGSTWAALGAGLSADLFLTDQKVWALESFDDGHGPALYAGGSFTASGAVRGLHGIAKWDGASWTRLGGGLRGVTETVFCLKGYDDGGPALYAGGSFNSADGVAVNHIARWDGSNWAGLSTGVSDDVWSLAVHDDGSGPALYAGGQFYNVGGVPTLQIAKWDGSRWAAVGTGLFSVFGPGVAALAGMDGPDGPVLFAGGSFTFAGNLQAGHIANWNGSRWDVMGGLSDTVNALTVHDDGSGTSLYASGENSIAASEARVVRWDGSSWEILGPGLNSMVRALGVYDDGGGPALYAGGDFGTAGGVNVRRVAKWNGTAWSSLGGGMNGSVFALAVYDDGRGPALYAGGAFTTGGGIPANRIARWAGSSWSPLGAGMDGTVLALTVHDDGSGPALYAGGSFTTAGGIAASRIAKWNGSSWSALGSGVNNDVSALTAFDDGNGPTLCAGGFFTTAGGVAANRIARWDGSSWSALGSGVDGTVLALTGHDDGSGPALYAGGRFTSAGGMAANRIAMWNGSSWVALRRGTSAEVRCLATFHGPERGGPGLVAGGPFLQAFDSLDSYVARWQGCPDTTPPILACPASISVPDPRPGPPGEIVTFAVTASDDRDSSPSVVCVPASGSLFPPGITLVVCKATDGVGNQASCTFEVDVQRKQGQ